MLESGEVILHSDHGAGARPQLVTAAFLPVDPNDQGVAPDLELGLAPSEAPADRIAIAAIRDEALSAQPSGLGEHDLVGAPPLDRMQLLLLELGERDHARRGVDPLGADGVAPPPRLLVEVGETAEGTPDEEVAPDEPDGALDLTLRLGPIRPAEAGSEAVVLREVLEVRIPTVLLGRKHRSSTTWTMLS